MAKKGGSEGTQMTQGVGRSPRSQTTLTSTGSKTLKMIRECKSAI